MKLDASEYGMVSHPNGAGFDGFRPPELEIRFVSIGYLLRRVGRRWLLLAAIAAAGLAVGIGLSVVYPPVPAASTLLLLRHTGTSNPTRAMLTDVRLVQTRAVASMVSSRLHLDRSDSLSYTAKAVSDDLLRVTATGPTYRAAGERANAVADAFLTFRRDEIKAQTDLVVVALTDQESALTAELAQLNSRISTFPSTPVGAGPTSSVPAGATTTTTVRPGEQLSDLVALRTSLEDRLAALRRQITNSQLQIVSDTSHVIDRASPDYHSKRRELAINGAAGLVAGLGLGAGGVLMFEVLSDRVRRRDEILAALQAPVARSIDSQPRWLWLRRRKFRRKPLQPIPAFRPVIDYLHEVADATGKKGLVVVPLSSEHAAGLAVASLAAQLVAEGRRVMLVDASVHGVLAGLFRVSRDATRELTLGDSAGSLCVAPAVDGGRLRDGERDYRSDFEADVVLALAVIDPRAGAWHLTRWAGTAVAVVTAGESTTEQLQAASRMVANAGLTMLSAVLFDADPADVTSGLPDEVSNRRGGRMEIVRANGDQ